MQSAGRHENPVENAWLRFVLIASLLPLCWLGMQAVHEFGHVLGAVATGAEVRRVVLHPLTISRTDLGANPSPLVVVWAGPAVGVLLPVLVWFPLRLAGAGVAYLFRFLAGFCLVANGAYVGIGPWYAIGDARVMRQLEPSTWPLLLFGLVCVPAGFRLWQGQGRRFGLGEAAEPVSPTHAWTTVIALTLALVLGFAFGA